MIPIVKDCEMSENNQPLKPKKKLVKKKELRQDQIFIMKNKSKKSKKK